MHSSLPPKLIDCKFYPSGVASELLIVEGDSAANAVANMRNPSFQAVLPMQGKPLNAWKASKPVVARNAFFSAVIQSLGAGWGDTFELDRVRYQKVVMIFDPDADGIHCGMLMLMFFYRWMLPLLESGQVWMVRPPLCQISGAGLSDVVCVGTPEDVFAEVKRLRGQGFPDATSKPFRGLASMGGAILAKHCVTPETRNAVPMRVEDADIAIRIFSPNTRPNK